MPRKSRKEIMNYLRSLDSVKFRGITINTDEGPVQAIGLFHHYRDSKEQKDHLSPMFILCDYDVCDKVIDFGEIFSPAQDVDDSKWILADD